MPPRGTPGLWPVRVLTDFGKDAYVLWPLALALFVIALVCAGLKGTSRARWLRFGTQVEYVFFAVLFPVLIAEVVKWTVGRGRPFVGGKANAVQLRAVCGHRGLFQLSLRTCGNERRAGVCRRVGLATGKRFAMFVYAILIAATRLVLLAHHPSDVVAGAVIGVAGAMAVRYWFAVRHLGFAVHANGEIVPL